MKFIAVFLSLFIFFAHADKIRIGSDAWEEVTEQDGSGIYFKLLKEIYGAENVEIKIESYHRGLKSFDDQKIDIIVGIFTENDNFNRRNQFTERTKKSNATGKSNP